MNKIETLILTPRGDVVVCRCLEAVPRRQTPEVTPNGSASTITSEDVLCQTIVNSTLCLPCAGNAAAFAAFVSGNGAPKRKENKGGLLGGRIDYEMPLGAQPLHEDEHMLHSIRPMELMVPPLLQGVPTCMPALNQIRISSVSAHPLGSHVLMISSEALLFSYGVNNHGQLGLGNLEPYVSNPSIVVPLLEDGGKAVSCAAGVYHSLVVIRTDENRTDRHRSKINGRASKTSLSPRPLSPTISTSPPTLGWDDREDEYALHEVYAFGQNDGMKLGLSNLREKRSECVSLPCRTALHTKVPAKHIIGRESKGVLQVAASLSHSLALVKSPSGAIEVYSWGDAIHGALALPSLHTGLTDTTVITPTKVPSLSYNPNDETSNILNKSEYATRIAVGPHSTFIQTSQGRCFSFGSSKDGLLGTGTKKGIDPMSIQFPRDAEIASISIGARHAMARTSKGQVFAWGRLPLSKEVIETPKTLQLIQPMANICAGYDSSLFVSVSGRVLSNGESSGRLGQGEDSVPLSKPTPLYGGLRLWRKRKSTPV